LYDTIYGNTALGNIGKPHKQCIVAIYAITLHIVNNTEICCATKYIETRTQHVVFYYPQNSELHSIKQCLCPLYRNKHTQPIIIQSCLFTPKNESATPSSIDKMPPYASLPEIKLTSTHMLHNREQQTGIQLSHTRRSQKYDEQMMAMEYIDNEAKIDDTSACTITSPPFVISLDQKKSLISGSQHVTKRNLNYCDIEASDHESVSHQTSHSVSASLPDDMWCRKMSFADHCALSISITKKKKHLLTTIA
jgi:hypothetical protein